MQQLRKSVAITNNNNNNNHHNNKNNNTGDFSAPSFLFQRISVAVQRFRPSIKVSLVMTGQSRVHHQRALLTNTQN